MPEKCCEKENCGGHTWLPRERVKNPNKKWYQVWKSSYIYKELIK